MDTPASQETNPEPATSRFQAQWHHRPPVPIQVSPFFAWPPNPMRMVRWLAARWFNIAENSILVGVACVSWFWFQPPLEEAKTLAFGWIAEIYLRNLVLLTIVAGGLHLYFFTWKQQGKRLKFDPRDLKASGRTFTFNSQVADNVFWSLVSGVFFWTAYEVLMFWAMANGYAPDPRCGPTVRSGSWRCSS